MDNMNTATATYSISRTDWRGRELANGKFALRVTRTDGHTYMHNANYKSYDAAERAARRMGLTAHAGE